MPNLVSKEFNEMCTEAGVQCVITAQTFGEYLRRYELSNLSKNNVTFLYKGKISTLDPGQKLVLLAKSDPVIVSHSVWYEKAWA